jgi:hypothetical protein
MPFESVLRRTAKAPPRCSQPWWWKASDKTWIKDLRQAGYKGLREDKKASNIVLERTRALHITW